MVGGVVCRWKIGRLEGCFFNTRTSPSQPQGNIIADVDDLVKKEKQRKEAMALVSW